MLPTLFGVILAGGLTAAQADVQLFGHIDTSTETFDRDVGGLGANGIGDDTQFKCTTCAIGFRGSEDLGNGLKAIFQIDFQYNTMEVNTGLPDRDQWLGMAGHYGQQRQVGTISTGYRSHGAMLDPIYRTALRQRDHGLQSNLHAGAGSSGQGPAENTARYDRPSWNGLKIGATYTLVPDSNPNAGGQVDDDKVYGGGISYENAGILVYADYLTNDSGGDDEAYKFGGKYNFNNFSVFGQYEIADGLITSKDPDMSGDGANSWMLGGTFMLGNSMLFASYGRADGDGLLSNYSSWTLAGMYSMSKRTKLYAGANSIDCDNQDTNVCDNVGDKGGKDQQFNLGMKHLF